MSEEDNKQSKDLDHLFFGESITGKPFLSLKCNRENCWLNGKPVKEWRVHHIDYAEVSGAVFTHQMQHLGVAMANIFKVPGVN